MIYARYGAGADSILRLPFMEGTEILQYAEEQKSEELLYLRWLLGYEKHMSFEDFKRNAVKVIHQVRPRSQKEILSNVKDILEMRVE